MFQTCRTSPTALIGNHRSELTKQDIVTATLTMLHILAML